MCLPGALSLLIFLGSVQGPVQAQVLKMTTDQLVSFIKSSIQLRHDDSKVADYVRRIKLSDKLDEHTVEVLQGMGAGPRTVVALRALSASSASLPAPPPPPPPTPVVVIPPPDSIEQKQILAQITEQAIDYTKNLPNFICTQVTRRYLDRTGQQNFALMDTIQERLSYLDHKEDYKVQMINGQSVTTVKHEQLGGATSSGEFGTMLEEIFNPETDTRFEWDHWATLRGRRTYVFSFRVEQSRSKYSIYSEEAHREIIAGYHGLIYADRDSKMVMRIKFDCDDIPAGFPVQKVSLDLNYDYTKIADQEFVLPLKSELTSQESGKYQIKNDIEFRLYNKFGAESTFIPDLPDPLPADKTQEQPAGAPSGKP